jgi:hypothetical protein
MGDVISLEQHRRSRRPVRDAAGAPSAAFSFDLYSPWTYLAAARVDRMFAGVVW